ncbi:cytochrome P450 [Nocardia sp. NPDC005366]|uniref:cytochrome P450 n=1 Tax=Nocardia sp. NPDC005366 TaxID=3156878 RepID=UPI0033BEA395
MTKSAVEFDPFSEEFYAKPYEIYRRMRQDAPVYYNAEYDFYALTRHADVAAAFKDHGTYSSARGVDLAQVKSGVPPQKSIIFMDPPDHRHMRNLLSRAFTPRAVQSQRDTISDLVRKYLDGVDPAGFDLIQDFSALFPVEVITRMAGVPEEFRQQVRLWIDESLHREPGQMEMSESGVQAATDTSIFYYNLVQQRRAEPRDDMISALIAAEIERDNGETTTLDDLEIAAFATLLGGAGAETVTKLLGNAVAIFARHPDQWRKLLDDRDKIPAAVEEVLRYEGPVQYNVRCTRTQVRVHDVTIPAGKPVFLIGASANRDPDAFPDADTFDIDRDRTRSQNLGLGYGIHSCLGAALARLETTIALAHLLDFMPRYEILWDRCERVTMQNVAGWSRLPMKVLR